MLYDPERRWLHRGSCRAGVDPERFFVSGGNQLNRTPSATTQAAWNQAKKICSFCPVLQECQRDTLGEEYGVWGGRDEHERYLARKRIGRGEWKRWPEERRLEWGEHLARLRERSISWKEIHLRTGLGPTTCDALIKEWERSRPAPEPVRKAASVPPPPKLASFVLRDFPEAPGQRHMWVRHRGGVSDGWYAGETEDGVWVRAQVWAGQGNVIKWVRREDVRIYNPQRVYHLKYIGRAKRERSAVTKAA